MLRHAWRRLSATPTFTVFAVVSLALGVGVTTAIYSVIVSLTGSVLAIPNADRVGVIVGTDPFEGRRPAWRSVISRADFIDLQSSSASLGDLAASAVFYQSVVDAAVSEVAVGEAVTGNYFSMLGVSPHLGRLIQVTDDGASPSRVVVLGHRFWRTKFRAASEVVGRIVRIGGQPFEIAGVAPEGFAGLNDQTRFSTSVWVPLAATSMFPSGAAPPPDPTDRRRRQLTILMAPSPGADLHAISAELATIGARLDTAFPIDMRRSDETAPRRQPRAWSTKALSAIAADADGSLATVESVVMAIVGLVLVVACTNLANLVLARGSSRLHELAVRRALGASRVRLVLEQLAETGLLAVMGAMGAFIVTRLLIVWFTSASLPISESQIVQLEPDVNVSTLMLAALSVLGSLVVFGVAPALQLTRVQLRPALSSEGGSTGHLRWRTRQTLILVQVAISLSFSLIAVFGVRIVLAERAQPSGVDLERLALGTLNLHLPPWDETRARQAVDRLMALAASEPDVEAIAVSSGMPFGTNYTPIATVTAMDKPFLPGREDYPDAPLLAATPSIFKTLGVPVVRGRGFDGRDVAGGEPAAVLSEVTAKQLFGTIDVVGRQILLRNSINMLDRTTVKTLTVVGVAGDTDTQHRYSRRSGVVYLPLAQHHERILALSARARGDPALLGTRLKTLVRQADPDLVLDRPGTAAMSLTGAYFLVGVVSRVAGGLAVLAMILAMAGLFGVLSHLVARRTREMGLRMALGAEPAGIRRLVLADGLRPVAGGLVLGLGIGGLVRLIMRSAYNSPLSPADAVVFLIAPLPILAAALVACYWPARRASNVDPNVALRDL